MGREGLFEEQKERELGGIGHGRGHQVQSSPPWGPLLPGHPPSCADEDWCQGGRDSSTASRLRPSLLCQEQDPAASALSRCLWVCPGLLGQVLLAVRYRLQDPEWAAVCAGVAAVLLKEAR